MLNPSEINFLTPESVRKAGYRRIHSSKTSKTLFNIVFKKKIIQKYSII
jgi:hypothetical protein